MISGCSFGFALRGKASHAFQMEPMNHIVLFSVNNKIFSLTNAEKCTLMFNINFLEATTGRARSPFVEMQPSQIHTFNTISAHIPAADSIPLDTSR